MQDVVFREKYQLPFGNHQLELFETPGHSKGSICILFDKNCLFSGDSMLNCPVITKLPSGSKNDYQSITVPLFNKLDRNMIVYPGHGQYGSISDMVIG